MIPAITNMDPVAPKAGEDVNLDKVVVSRLNDHSFIISKVQFNHKKSTM